MSKMKEWLSEGYRKLKHLLRHLIQQIIQLYRKLDEIMTLHYIFLALSILLIIPMLIRYRRHMWRVLHYILIIPFLLRKIGELKHRTQKKIWGVLFLLPWILGFLLFFLRPFVESFIYSFSKVELQFGGVTRTWVKWQNYYDALRVDPDFLPTLISATRSTLINLPVIIIFSLLLAVILNTEFRGRTVARAIFFIPVIFNSEAVATALGGGAALRQVMEQYGLGLVEAFDFEGFLLASNIAPSMVGFLIGSVQQIYDIVSQSGVQILMFLAGLQAIPIHLYEAAKIEGATQYEVFWKITLPMVSPMIVTATVYTIVQSFISSPITEVIQDTGTNFGLNAAMSWIYFGVTSVMLAVILFFLSKVVFYYDK